MTIKLLGLCIGLTLLVGASAGCDMLTPGNEGWRCETSKDCKGELRCRTYKFKGHKDTRRFCTGNKALTTSKETYSWFLVVAAWLMILGLPLLVVVLKVVAVIRNRKGEASLQHRPDGHRRDGEVGA